MSFTGDIAVTGIAAVPNLGSGPPGGSQPPRAPNRPLRSSCGPQYVVNFLQAHADDATELGAAAGVSPTYILGLSAHETQWGANRFARVAQNFFSIEGGSKAPFAVGVTPALGNGAPVTTFRSYLDGGRSFVALYGATVRGASSPSDFANRLVPSFNSANARTRGDPQFRSKVVGAINAVERRSGCY